MRCIFLSCSLLLLACQAPAAKPAPQPTIDVPAHTQALIDAYRQREAMRAQQGGAPEAPACPGEASLLQQRERYLSAIGGCMEQVDPTDPSLDVASPAQWPALYAALDAPNAAVDACLRAAHTWFDLTGKMVTRVELAADGTLRALRTVHDDSTVPDLACCVRRALRGVRLPAPGRPIALELTHALDARTLHDRYAGELPREELRAALAEHSPELRACYDDAVERGLTHGGRVSVRFVIAPSGDVPRAAVVEDEVGAPSAACCLTEKVRSWKFRRPERDGPVWVTYPFDLQLGH